MTLNTFSSGINTDFSTELNQNFNKIGGILSIDSSTDLNVSLSSNATTSSSSDKTYSFSSAQMSKLGDYLVVMVNGMWKASASSSSTGNGAEGSCTFKLEKTAPSSSTLVEKTIVETERSTADITRDNNNTNFFIYYYTVQSEDRSSGASFKITMTASTSGNGVNPPGTASFTNVQIIFKSSDLLI